MKNSLTLAFFALFAAACNMSNTNTGDTEIRKHAPNAHVVSHDNLSTTIDVLMRSNIALAQDISLLEATMKEIVATKPHTSPILDISNAFNADFGQFDAMISEYLNQKTNAKAIDYLAFKAQYELICSSLAEQLNNLEGLQVSSFRLTSHQSNEFLLASLLGGKAIEMPSQDEFQKLSNNEVLFLLHTFQFNARATYSDFIQLLLDVQTLDIKFDHFEVISSPQKSAIVLGEEYETAFMLGASSKQAKFAINIDGKPTPVINGQAIYTSRPTKAGEYSYTVEATLTNPLTGEVVKSKRVFDYDVLSPPVFVSTADNDVLYVGEAQKLNILTPSYSTKDISLSVSGTAGAVVSYEEGNTYTVRAERQGTAFIKITNTQTNQIIGENSYIVKAR